jgi:hypothetical protein
LYVFGVSKVKMPAFGFSCDACIHKTFVSEESCLAGATAANKVVSRSSGVGNGTSPLAFGVEDDSVSTRRATSKDTTGPETALLITIYT